MFIKKSVWCNITLFKDDAISHVLVTKAYENFPDQYGLIVKDGIPTYVCSTLYLEGGTAVNVQVKDGGIINAKSGIIDNIAVCRGGRLDVCIGAKATDIRECGGVVYGNIPWTMSEECKDNMKFTPMSMWLSEVSGVMSLHEGTRFYNLTVYKDVLIDVIGGELVDSVFNCGTIEMRYGTLRNITLQKNSMLTIYSGTAENITIGEGCTLRLGDQSLETYDFTAKNVVIKKGAKIIRSCTMDEHGDLHGPSINQLTIEGGVVIQSEYELPDESIEYEEAVYPDIPILSRLNKEIGTPNNNNQIGEKK